MTYSVSWSSDAVVRQLSTVRTRFDNLNTQLNTQRKAETYGGLGLNRSLDLAMKRQLAEIGTFSEATNMADLHLRMLNQTSGRLEAVRREAKGAADQNNFNLFANGRTSTQNSIEVKLREAISLLNNHVGGRHLFSGRSVDRVPVMALESILDGSGNKSGLRAVMEEYRQADLGSAQNGRLTIARAGGTVNINEDGVHPFGIKISGISSSMTNVTVNHISASPAGASVEFTGKPGLNQSVRLEAQMPDGSRTPITLIATYDTDLENGFQIGANPAETAQNFETALNTKLKKMANGELRAASAIRAAKNFFDTAPRDPAPAGYVPQARVAPGPGGVADFANATALRDGTADTVTWYQGDNRPGNPRADSKARIDENLTVSFGARANEQGFQELLSGMAVMVAADFSATNMQNRAFYGELVQRANTQLTTADNESSDIRKMNIEIATTWKTVKDTGKRHKTTSQTLQGVVAGYELVDRNEVSAKLLMASNQLQSSYRATALALNMSLSKYI